MAWPEYQLEAINKNEITKDENDALKSINGFLSKKNNYKEAKDAWEKNTDKDIQNIRKTYTNLEKKVKEKKTTVTSVVTKEQTVTTERPAQGIETTTDKTTRITEDRMDNLGQTKGKIDFISKEQVASIVGKIKENMDNPNFSVSIIWRSDANLFVEWSTATQLQKTHSILINGLREDLPDQARRVFTKPDRPTNWTEQQISDWLNVILAQSRALQTMKDIRDQIGVQDFKKVMDKGNTEFTVKAHEESFEWEDRGVSVICKTNTNKEWSSTTLPKPLSETKEIIKEKEHFELYQSIQFITPDGKTFYKMFKRSMMIENKPGKESTLTPKWRTPINSKRNSQNKIIPSNQETAGRAIKNPNKYGAPDMEAESKKDVTQRSAVLEKTIVKHTDGTVTTTEEYTTSSPSKIVLPQVTYNLTKSETKNNIYDATATDIIPYLEKTYPIKTPDDVRALVPETSETIHP